MRAIIFCLFVAITGTALAQQPNIADGDIRLSRDHPAIYLTFERRGKGIDPMQSRLGETGDTELSKQKGDDIWLRLHNNCRWAILFPTWSLYVGKRLAPFRLSDGRSVLSLTDDIEVNARYVVAEQNSKTVPYGGDSYSSSWLAPGRSVIFSVAREHLAHDRSIYLYFNYEWERSENWSYNLAPEHRVMYWGYRLESDAK